MKKSLFTLPLIALMTFAAHADNGFKEPLNQLTPKQKEFRDKAAAGDYQGMRNIAYTYQAPSKGEAGSKIAACAWYLLIPVVHKQKFDAGDTGNVYVSCGKLAPDDLDRAYAYAFRVLAK